MKHTEIVDFSHLILKAKITKDDVMVDATMGQGYDTCFLAKHAKHVFAFDIQKIALEQTIKRLTDDKLFNVTLYHESHENIIALVKDFKGVIFNLGYLPLGDHAITTRKETTLKTVDMILSVLKPKGFVLLVIYPGHQAGYEESLALHDYLKDIDHKLFSIIRLDLPFTKSMSPYILYIEKR